MESYAELALILVIFQDRSISTFLYVRVRGTHAA